MWRMLMILGFCVLVFCAATWAQGPRKNPDNSYVACADRRVMTYGPGQRSEPMAEMAAIARWMAESKALGKGYDDWALAQDRWLKCHRVGKTPFMQCKIAALPCRPKDA